MIKVLCIDDTNMPSDFPIPSCWPVKGQEYHVVNIKFVTLSKCLGYQLSEISLENCYPYAFFDSKRFSIAQEDLEALLALMKDCKTRKDNDMPEELDIDLNEYIEHLTVRELEAQD